MQSTLEHTGWHGCLLTTFRHGTHEPAVTCAPGSLACQVGGLGLTLTAADRVIILDPAWNPSTGELGCNARDEPAQGLHTLVGRSAGHLL